MQEVLTFEKRKTRRGETYFAASVGDVRLLLFDDIDFIPDPTRPSVVGGLILKLDGHGDDARRILKALRSDKLPIDLNNGSPAHWVLGEDADGVPCWRPPRPDELDDSLDRGCGW